MRNAFIVSTESYKGPVTAEGLRTVLYRSWDRASGISFRVEEGGIGVIAKLVNDYLTAEEELQKYEVENDIHPGSIIDSWKGEMWRKLSENLREKRETLVGTLRQYGQVV